MEMTRASLLEVCKQHKLYRTPALNDKLYCNFKGYTRIANLEPYTALKALFLEGNALDSLAGLPRLEELKCLYVQQNCITSLSHLEGAPNLDTLNVSSNPLPSLEGLQACPALRTLVATHCKLGSAAALQPLLACPGVQTLDLQDNELKGPGVLELLQQLPELRCLYLRGNPCVSAIQHYRKALVAALPSLNYLDDRPVFEVERRCAEAWAAGGLDAERAARAAWQREQEDAQRRNFEALQAIRREGWRKRRQQLGLPEGDTDPALDEFSDEEWVPGQEPAELEAARAALAAYSAREGEEEAPELTTARAKLAGGGGAVQPGAWGGAASAEADGRAYLESVRDNQRAMASEARGRPAASPLPKAASAAAAQLLASRQQDTDLCKLSDQLAQEPDRQPQALQQAEEQPAAAGPSAPSAEPEAQQAAEPLEAVAVAGREGPEGHAAEVAAIQLAKGQEEAVEEQQAVALGAEASTLQLEDIAVLGLGQGQRPQQGQGEQGELQEGAGEGGGKVAPAAAEASQGSTGLVKAAVQVVVQVVAEGEKAAAEVVAQGSAEAFDELDLFELD